MGSVISEFSLVSLIKIPYYNKYSFGSRKLNLTFGKIIAFVFPT